MSNRVTYRVTGDDWDAPGPGADPALPETAASGDIPVDDVKAFPDVPHPDPAPGIPSVPPAEPAMEGTLDLADEPRRDGAAPPLAALLTTAGRLPPVHVGGRTVPSQPLVLGVAAIAVIGGMALLGGRPVASSLPTAAPTVLAPAATTAGCAGTVPELPAPVLRVVTPGASPVDLAGVAGTATTFKEDADWVAAFGQVEASLAPASTMTVPAADACVVEWRAVAAQAPAGTPAKWHPARKDQVELGWQRADRERWSPVVPLPPRGEWVIRLTIWYRTALVAAPASAVPGASVVATPAPATSGPGSQPRLMVERYFHVAVGAPAGS